MQLTTSKAVSFIPRWLAPPVLATPECTRRAHALWVVSWPFFAVVTVALALAVAVEPETLSRRAVTITAVGMLVLVLHMLNQRGRTTLASWMLVVGLTLIVTQRAWLTGGIHAPVSVFYALFICMAGALLGTRAGIVTALLSLVCALGLTVAQATGVLAVRAGEGPVLAAFVFVVLTVGLAVVVLHIVAHMASAPSSKRDDYVQMLVHDLRSPISAVQAHLQLLREDAPTVAPQVDEALDGTRTLERMTQNLLDLGRFEAGAMPVKLAFTNVGNVARGVVRALSAVAPNHDIRVVAASTVGWTCDPELLRRVIDNLVCNAIKHTPAGGAIRVYVKAEDESLRIAVQDDGPGISLAMRGRLFEKFGTDAPLADANGRHSTGLGLAFCKFAVDAHGGAIRVEDAVPKGSVFIVELPA